MAESVMWLKELLVDYSAFQYVLVFLGAAIGGDFVLIGMAFLSAQGFLFLPIVFIFSFLGTFVSDIVLFLLARTALLHYIISHKYATRTTSMIVESLMRVGRRNHTLSLTIAKFLVATRAIIMMYADKTDISLKDFSVSNAIATLVWVIVVVPIGYFLGMGFTYFSEVLENVYAGIGIVLLFFVLASMFEIWMEKKFTAPEE